MLEFCISFLFTFILGVIGYDTSHIAITRYRIKTKEINKKLKICLLSDLHNNSFGEDRLYESIINTNPDLVIMSGDMVNTKISFADDNAINLVKKLSAHYPVYYGIGNHEARLSWDPTKFDTSYDELLMKLKECGAVVLDNESIFLDKFGINITGLNLSEDYYGKIYSKKDIKGSIDDYIPPKPSDYEILIAHNPEYFDKYVKRGSNLILSGHLHGGIMRLPFNFGAISPRLALFPKFAWGMYKNGLSRMVVSRGLGQHTIPIRVFNTAELIFIEIN